MKKIMILCFALLSSLSHADLTIPNRNPESIPFTDMQNANAYPKKVKEVLTSALELTHNNLTYTYGSADPKAGGMDCSGTIYYILTKAGVKNVPRASHLIYKWAVEQGHFYPVNATDVNSPEFAHMNPGDLLFWKGTYNVKRDPDVTHVMMYLGKNKAGQPLMIGSSDGRTYKGRKIWGVSVFDFQLPNASSASKFLGYSCTPEINCVE